MKIIKFVKKKNGMYLLKIEDGNEYKVHEDLILKYGLLLHKELDDDLVEKILEENKVYEVYEVTLKYLNVRLRSKNELYAYLIKKGYSEEITLNAIQKLKIQGYLNDKVYATSFVHDKILMSSYGPNKIRSELEKNGIDNEIILLALNDYTEELEKNRIQKIIDKQIKQNHNKGSMLLKRKIQAYLLNLGYSNTYINQALNGKKLVDEDIPKQEYQKLYNKLSKKYSGRELEYKIKQKMYQKGFTSFNYDE